MFGSNMVTAVEARAITNSDNLEAKLERAFIYIRAAAVDGKCSVHVQNNKAIREALEHLGYVVDPYSMLHMEIKW